MKVRRTNCTKQALAGAAEEVEVVSELLDDVSELLDEVSIGVVDEVYD
jgi:uncharacterized protein with von Willebrand factor type A (vWA) domain